MDYILKEIRPERIGHAVCLNSDYQKYLFENPLPIEICPTSNLHTLLVKSIDAHPFYEFWSTNKSYPLIICTDDRGMFNTSQTREHHLISQSFKLTLQDLLSLNKQCLDVIFDQTLETRRFLENRFDEIKYL